jgi:hypothetical protein
MTKKDAEGDLNLIVCNGMPLYPQLSTFYGYSVSMPHGGLSARKLPKSAWLPYKVFVINGLDGMAKKLAIAP